MLWVGTQLYYPDDGMITSDADIQAFWDHFQTKQVGHLELFLALDHHHFYLAFLILIWDDQRTTHLPSLAVAQLKKPWKLPTLTRDALGDLLAELIWNVTGNHEMIGSIVEYLTVPNGLATKLVPNKDEADIQSFAQAVRTHPIPLSQPLPCIRARLRLPQFSFGSIFGAALAISLIPKGAGLVLRSELTRLFALNTADHHYINGIPSAAVDGRLDPSL